MTKITKYTPNKIDVFKIIKAVFNRKDWGKTYTLYDNTKIEVELTMESYHFDNNYALFKLVVNEKTGGGYSNDTFRVYTDREDYTKKFVELLILKTILRLLKNCRRGLADREANKIYPYIFMGDKSTDEWLELYHDQSEIEALKKLECSETLKDKLLETIASKTHDTYLELYHYTPLSNHIDTLLNDENYNSNLLEVAEEIKELIIEKEKEDK